MKLEDPVFSLGQLYIKCSQMEKPENLFVQGLLDKAGKVNNVMYYEALSKWKSNNMSDDEMKISMWIRKWSH